MRHRDGVFAINNLVGERGCFGEIFTIIMRHRGKVSREFLRFALASIELKVRRAASNSQDVTWTHFIPRVLRINAIAYAISFLPPLTLVLSFWNKKKQREFAWIQQGSALFRLVSSYKPLLFFSDPIFLSRFRQISTAIPLRDGKRHKSRRLPAPRRLFPNSVG